MESNRWRELLEETQVNTVCSYLHTTGKFRGEEHVSYELYFDKKDTIILLC